MTAWPKQFVLFRIDGAGKFYEQADMPNFGRVLLNCTVRGLTARDGLENEIPIAMKESQEL